MEKFRNQMKNQLEKQIDLLDKKSGKKSKIIIAIISIGVILTAFGFLDKYITCAIGILLPTYWSIKSIETKEADDDKMWLTYWVVYGCFTFIDLFAGIILKILPFYFLLKLVFLIWCFMPNTKGALFIYNNIIVKVFKKYEQKIDEALDKGKEKMKEINDKIKGKVKEVYEKNKDEIINKGMEVVSNLNKKE